MKALIIGANGFAGGYMRKELLQNGYAVAGADKIAGDGITELDLLDRDGISRILSEEAPDVVFNLAGFASVAKSYEMPQAVVDLNVIGTINLLEAVRNYSKSVRVLLIGSSDQYGEISEDNNPVNESTLLNPVSPYAISKCCQEDFGRSYVKLYDMNICMTRSFNHIGVGQSRGFVITDFASGIADIEKGKRSVLRVGNTSSKRCFTDVRDTVRAYRLIGEMGNPGEVYNVGSEKVYSIQEILNKLVSLSTVPITIERDAAKLRAFDTPCVQCDCSLLEKVTDWSPSFPIEETLLEILNYFRRL